MGYPIDQQQLLDDIFHAAELVGETLNRSAVQAMVNAFAHPFTNSTVEFRTTTKPDMGLSFRFVDFAPTYDALEVATENNLIPAPEVGKVLEPVQTFPLLAYGVDGGRNGLEKIWPFLAQARPMPEAYAYAEFPRAIPNYQHCFEAYQLNHFAIVAADFAHHSMNLYGYLRPKTYSAATIRDLVTDFGFELPDNGAEERIENALAYNLTFRWDSEEIQRLCFYSVAPSRADVPTHLDDRLTPFVQHVPSLVENPIFILGDTFTHSGYYLKVESDYTGDLAETFMRCVQTTDQSLLV